MGFVSTGRNFAWSGGNRNGKWGAPKKEKAEEGVLPGCLLQERLERTRLLEVPLGRGPAREAVDEEGPHGDERGAAELRVPERGARRDPEAVARLRKLGDEDGRPALREERPPVGAVKTVDHGEDPEACRIAAAQVLSKYLRLAGELPDVRRIVGGERVGAPGFDQDPHDVPSMVGPDRPDDGHPRVVQGAPARIIGQSSGIAPDPEPLADLSEPEGLVERDQPRLANDAGDIEEIARGVRQPLGRDEPQDRGHEREPATPERPRGRSGPPEQGRVAEELEAEQDRDAGARHRDVPARELHRLEAARRQEDVQREGIEVEPEETVDPRVHVDEGLEQREDERRHAAGGERPGVDERDCAEHRMEGQRRQARPGPAAPARRTRTPGWMAARPPRRGSAGRADRRRGSSTPRIRAGPAGGPRGDTGSPCSPAGDRRRPAGRRSG